MDSDTEEPVLVLPCVSERVPILGLHNIRPPPYPPLRPAEELELAINTEIYNHSPFKEFEASISPKSRHYYLRVVVNVVGKSERMRHLFGHFEMLDQVEKKKFKRKPEEVEAIATARKVSNALDVFDVVNKKLLKCLRKTALIARMDRRSHGPNSERAIRWLNRMRPPCPARLRALVELWINKSEDLWDMRRKLHKSHVIYKRTLAKYRKAERQRRQRMIRKEKKKLMLLSTDSGAGTADDEAASAETEMLCSIVERHQRFGFLLGKGNLDASEAEEFERLEQHLSEDERTLQKLGELIKEQKKLEGDGVNMEGAESSFLEANLGRVLEGLANPLVTYGMGGVKDDEDVDIQKDLEAIRQQAGLKEPVVLGMLIFGVKGDEFEEPDEREVVSAVFK